MALQTLERNPTYEYRDQLWVPKQGICQPDGAGVWKPKDKRFNDVLVVIPTLPLELINGRYRPIRGAAANAWTFINTARTNLLNGTHDIDTDSWKMALFLSTSDISATETTFAGVTAEHAAANGYTAGGIAITLTLAGTTTVTVDISTDPVWTAAGGSIVCRFAVIYEVAGNVLCFTTLDNTPADVTATDGNTLTVAAHASGVFTLA
jgi:hypothetical protein